VQTLLQPALHSFQEPGEDVQIHSSLSLYLLAIPGDL